ncbi:MAG: prepilin-type N-terminal cleavage/methylation domain-containing protein [Phycisphaera sp.]|nr:prepilin-type N-terminal cleavage/methylation domain-containing protein [Phycisphaera sp.]
MIDNRPERRPLAIRRDRRTAIRRRRGFNLVEVLIALAITASLLTATLVALDASFRAYQSTTEEVSTQSIGRIVMHRMLTLVRTGTEFGPFPSDPRVTRIRSDYIEFRTQDDQVVTIRWDRTNEVLMYEIDGQAPVELLDGVVGTEDGEGNLMEPFTLEFEQGRRLYRASIDLSVEPNDVIDLEIEGDKARRIRLVGSAMPRLEAF